MTLSPQGSAGRTLRFPAVTNRILGRRRHSESLRRRFILSRGRTGLKRAGQLGRQKDSELAVCFKSKAAGRRVLPTTNPESNDDIDDIFAIAGL